MKIIFLDIDGVLNSENWYKSNKSSTLKIEDEKQKFISDSFDPECWKYVEKLISETGAKIVLSSSWRLYDLESTVKEYTGTAFQPIIDNLIGVTPGFMSRCRGMEIKLYLRSLSEQPESYVILDDDRDMFESQRPYFVHINDETGITENDYKKALKILKNE